MTKIDFYDDLSNSNVGTIELGGMVMISKNKGKWHLCKRGGGAITYACGRGSPCNPFRDTILRNSSQQKDRFKQDVEVVQPKEALEKTRVCSHCENKLEGEFDLQRLVVAVSEDTPIDIAVERFVNRREESLK